MHARAHLALTALVLAALPSAIPATSAPPVPLAAQATGYDDAISREITISVLPDVGDDALSREITINAVPAVEALGAADSLTREVTVSVRQPDLSVSAIVVPATGEVDTLIDVSWTVVNTGDTDAVDWTDRLEFSDDDVIGDADDTLVVDVPLTGSLEPGGSLQRTLPVLLPADSGPVWVVVTTGLDVLESDETNVSAISSPINVVDLFEPDLGVASLCFPTDPIESSGVLQVCFSVDNSGPGPTSAPLWDDRIFLSPSGSGDPRVDGIELLTERNVSSLLPGGSYVQGTPCSVDASCGTLGLLVQLPPDIEGTYYLAVYTDVEEQVDETDELNNVLFGGPITLTLEPQPDLQVPLVRQTEQFEQLFPGQPYNITWQVTNFGAGVTGDVTWSDRVWISSNGDCTVPPDEGAGDILLGTFLRPTPLIPCGTPCVQPCGVCDAMSCQPGASYERTETLGLPVGLDPNASWWLKVETDAVEPSGELLELPLDPAELNNVGVSAELNIVPSVAPDLVLTDVALSGTMIPRASRVVCTWTVDEAGAPSWEVTLGWFDEVWLSTDTALDAGDVLLDDFSQIGTFSASAGTDVDYVKSVVLQVPESAPPGSYHLIVSVDAGADVPESNEGNNVLASPALSVLPLSADLELAVGVEGDLPPASGAAGQSITLPFTVTNLGGADTNVSSWFDSVRLVGNGEDELVAELPRELALRSGSCYPVFAQVQVPLVPDGAYSLEFRTDAQGDVFEDGATANNLVSVPFTVTPDAPDLVVDALAVPRSVGAGQPIVLQWTLRNAGTLATNATLWTDRVVLSTDEVLDPGDIELGTLTRTAGLAANEMDQQSASFVAPPGVGGLLWVIVEADAEGDVFESNETNNDRAARMQVDLAPLPPADLVVEGVAAAQSTVVSGQPLEITWTVRNAGGGPTDSGAWSDSVFLSRDEQLEPMLDTFLGYWRHETPLDAGESRTTPPLGEEEFIVPAGLSGPFFVIVAADRAGELLESDTTNNVERSALIVDVTLPPPSDLAVTSITTAAPTAFIGDTFDVDWTTENLAGGTADGEWSCSFYLSLDTGLDAQDVFLGTELRQGGALPQGQQLLQSASFSVPGVLPGPYHVLARVDPFGQIPEIDENNVSASAATVLVSAIEVTVDDPIGVTRSLPVGAERVFRVAAPGGGPPVAGDTLRIDLSHSSASAWTELYVRQGAVPSVGVFDLAFDSPGSSTQTIQVPSTTGGELFVLARATALVGTPDATLTAAIVPFALDAVAPETFGAGRVTLELHGSQMDEVIRAELRESGGSLIVATTTTITVVDAGLALATFELGGVATGPLDLYAVEVGGESGPVAVTLEAPLPVAVGAEIVVAPSIRKGRTGAATARVTNQGNVDLPRGLWVLGTSANAGAVTGMRVELESAPLGQTALESGDLGESLVLLVEDLGPAQSAEVALDISVDDAFARDDLPLGLSGRAFDVTGFRDGFVTDLAERLRLAVLADPASNAGLLAAAADGLAWRADVLAGFSSSVGVFQPGTVPLTGRDLVLHASGSATAGLDPLDAVSAATVDAVAGALPETLFAPTALAPAALFPALCGEARFDADVTVSAGAPPSAAVACAQTPTSDDPNEKNAPTGIGDMALVSSGKPLCYRIYFENVATAGSAAARVEIRDALAPSLAAASFRITEIQFGDVVVPLPGKPHAFQTQVDLSDREENAVLVNVTAGVDAATREAFFVLRALDPLTGETPAGGDLGVLPPNNEDGDGEGFVEFLILPSTDDTGIEVTVTTGTVVENSADIIFDINEGIGTEEVDNVVDADPPSSTVSSTGTGPDGSANLTWSGSDPAGGAGVASYSVFVSANGGPYEPLLVDTTATSTNFVGDPGSNYAFYSVAEDRTGNGEEPPTSADVTIFVECNGNGIPDDQDIASGTSEDCNENGVPDECDVDPANGFSMDSDGDGIPDECLPLGMPVCFGVSCPCGNDDPTAGCLNSTGTGGRLDAEGTRSVALDNLRLLGTNLPPNNTGLYVSGDGLFDPPIDTGDGLLCTGGLFRYPPRNVTPTGEFNLVRPIANGAPGSIEPGSTRVFQAWTRDVLCGPPPNPCPSPCLGGSNLTNAYQVLFVP